MKQNKIYIYILLFEIFTLALQPTVINTILTLKIVFSSITLLPENGLLEVVEVVDGLKLNLIRMASS